MARQYFFTSLVLLGIVIVSIVPVIGQEVPRISSGKLDLQGVWDFRTITPMERPEDQAEEFLSDEEAANLDQVAIERETNLATRPARRTEIDPTGNVDRGVDGAPGSYNNFWFDRGTTVISTKRTSLVIDPADGQIPTLTPEAKKKRDDLAEVRKNTGPHEPTPGGWVEDLGSNGLQVRCIVGFNSGPPMTPGGYNNNFQMFQTPDEVVIYNEMNHNPRVIPLDGRPYTGLRQWNGESRGRWEGDTLVIETKNFLRETSFMRGGASKDLEITERFTRETTDILIYEVTVTDPTTWMTPWTYQVPMQINPDPIFEYACHEGNYSMAVLLAGALEQ
jgi:hypothetical protein